MLRAPREAMGSWRRGRGGGSASRVTHAGGRGSCRRVSQPVVISPAPDKAGVGNSAGRVSVAGLPTLWSLGTKCGLETGDRGEGRGRDSRGIIAGTGQRVGDTKLMPPESRRNATLGTSGFDLDGGHCTAMVNRGAGRGAHDSPGPPGPVPPGHHPSGGHPPITRRGVTVMLPAAGSGWGRGGGGQWGGGGTIGGRGRLLRSPEPAGQPAPSKQWAVGHSLVAG